MGTEENNIKETPATERFLVITQVRSAIKRPAKHRRVLRALGLRKMHQTVVHRESPIIMGMVKKIPHLLSWEVKEVTS
jgi:large subunit ribosomal protein L30